MIVIPVIERELRAQARRPVTQWSRCLVAAFAALVSLQIVVFYGRSTSLGSSGPMAFSALAWLGLLLACGSAAATADSISSERREGTLGLLFLTDLCSFDILLAKITAAGLASFYALIGFVPILALAFLEGGVTGFQVASTGLALLNLIFVCLSLGLWCSTQAYDQYRAVRKTLLLLFLLLFLPEIAAAVGSLSGPKARVLGFFSPYHTFKTATSTRGSAEFWMSLLAAHLEGWLFLLAASISLRHNWGSTRGSEKLKAELTDSSARRTPRVYVNRYNELLEANPICWLGLRLHRLRGPIWLGTALMFAGSLGFPWLGLLWRSPLALLGLTNAGMWNGIHLGLALGSAALVAWAAGRLLFDARRNGELELLLSTPLGGRDIIAGYWWALWRQLRVPLLLFTFLLFLLSMFEAVQSGRMNPGPAWLFHFGIGCVNKVLDALALCWVAMWLGMRARKLFSFVAGTVGLVIVLPWTLSYLFTILIFASGGFGRGFRPSGLYPWTMGTPLLIIALKVILIRWAARRLKDELRASPPLSVGDWLREDARPVVNP
jgi:hypothetical protein